LIFRPFTRSKCFSYEVSLRCNTRLAFLRARYSADSCSSGVFEGKGWLLAVGETNVSASVDVSNKSDAMVTSSCCRSSDSSRATVDKGPSVLLVRAFSYMSVCSACVRE
jgi:hypothetical protein